MLKKIVYGILVMSVSFFMAGCGSSDVEVIDPTEAVVDGSIDANTLKGLLGGSVAYMVGDHYVDKITFSNDVTSVDWETIAHVDENQIGDTGTENNIGIEALDNGNVLLGGDEISPNDIYTDYIQLDEQRIYFDRSKALDYFHEMHPDG